MTTFVDFVFTCPPSAPESSFVETEDDDGCGVRIGDWIERQDGFWVLRVSRHDAELLFGATPTGSGAK